MKSSLEGKTCLVNTERGQKKARIIKVYLKVGFSGHGETFVSVIMQDRCSIWDGDRSYKLKDVEIVD